MHLSRLFPHLHFIVQDLPEVIDGAADSIAAAAAAAAGDDDIPRGKIEFLAHDMFEEQPVKNADVYLLRYVLHDWGDKYCVEILRRLVPSLKPGAKVVIQDHLLPEPGTMGLLQEMQMR